VSGRIRVDRVDSATVLAFWETSPHANGFNHPTVLAQLSQEVIWWGAWRSQELIAVWPICVDSAGQITPPDFTYFVGPMLSEALNKLKYHRAWAVQHQALTALTEVMVTQRRSLRFSLPIGLQDVRPWTWWNNANRESGQFVLTPRYTARIQGLRDRSETELLLAMDQTRRQEITSGGRARIISVDEWSPAEILSLADARFLKGEQDGGENRREALGRMLKLCETGRAEVLAFRQEGTGYLVSAMLMLVGRHDANNVLCVTSDAARGLNLSSWTTWQGILAAQRAGKEIFDFNGANTLARAQPKHWLGAYAHLYFDVAFNPVEGEESRGARMSVIV
jgi:hypothetical protein